MRGYARPASTCALAAFIVASFVVGSPVTWAQNDKSDKLDKKDTRVEPTSWGNVYGHVYDAVTGAPIEKAKISVQLDDGFQEKGRSVDDSDLLGEYKVQCVLGRISNNFDIGRALLSSPMGMLFGGATNTTKRIDVSRVNLKVHADGYKPFEGMAVARTQNAKAFRIDMEPILLVPDKVHGESVSAIGWAAVRIVDAWAKPSVAKKGDQIQLTALARAYGKDPGKAIEIVAVSPLWKGTKKLRYAKEQTSQTERTFELDYTVTGKEKLKAAPVYFVITKSNLDYDSRQYVASALIQISDAPTQDPIVSQRVEALDAWNQGENRRGMQQFFKVAEAGQQPYDWLVAARMAEELSAFSEAVNGWEKVRDNKLFEPSYYRPHLVEAYYRNRQYEKVIAELSTTIKKNPKDWQKEVDATAIGYGGLSLVKLDKLEEAQKISKSLLNWPYSGIYPAVIEFRGALRLAEVEKAHAAKPNSAEALCNYGRALLDLGRFEEGIAKLNESLELNPDEPGVKRDLIWAALQLNRMPEDSKDLDQAVKDAEKALNLEKGKQKSKDFFAWNQYAVLGYALAEQQKRQGDAGWEATRDRSIEALREALVLGRVGAKVGRGVFEYKFGYTTKSEVAISGFAYPQANASFQLLDSMKRLRAHPDDHLALFNQATALFDLGQTQLAGKCLEDLLKVKPDYLEATFLSALAAQRAEDPEKAKELLRAVVEQNPWHPRASLALSKLLAEEGDVSGSVEQMAAFEKHYGVVRSVK